MKKFFVLLAFLCFMTLSAQSDQDYIDLVKSTAKVEIKSYVYDGLELSEEEKKAFDPVFNKYLEESGEVSIKRANLFDTYAGSADDYTIDQINDLNKEVLKTDLKSAKTDKKYYNKFVKAIGVEKATEFFFLKKYLDNMVQGAKLDFLLEE